MTTEQIATSAGIIIATLLIVFVFLKAAKFAMKIGVFIAVIAVCLVLFKDQLGF